VLGTSLEVLIDGAGCAEAHSCYQQILAEIARLTSATREAAVCAALITLACVTGLILWLALPKRRLAGIAMLLIGAATLAVFVFYLVPGADLPLAQKRAPPLAAP
jgi:hypothetical protein